MPRKRQVDWSEAASGLLSTLFHHALDWLLDPDRIARKREIRRWRALAHNLREACGLDGDESDDARNEAVSLCCYALIEHLEDVEDGN